MGRRGSARQLIPAQRKHRRPLLTLIMEIKQLRAFIAVAETGSVTRAADVLHVVQPALSRQIRLLEEELGVPLFERERHGMVLTPAGRQFAERARNAIRELDLAKAELAPASAPVTGSVVIGYLPSTAELLTSRIMGALHHAHPLLLVRSFVTYVQDLEKRLASGEVDLALLYQRESTPAFQAEPLLDEFMYLVGPPEAALAMDSAVPLTALNGLTLVLPEPQHGLRRLVEKECLGAGIRPTVSAETNSMSVQKSLVMKGLGLTVLPGCAIREELLRGALSASPIAAPSLKRRILMARSPSSPPTPAALRAAEALRTAVRETVLEGGWPGATLVD